jgi:tetratricopeptide (TPR) repeat protein
MRSVILFVILVFFISACQKVENESELLINSGRKKIETLDYKGASEDFKKASEFEPKSANVFYYIGLAYYKIEEYYVAQTAFQTAVELDPNYSDAIVYFAKATKKYGTADDKWLIEMYNKAIDKDKNCASAYYERAMLEDIGAKQDFDTSIQCFGIMIQKEKDNAELYVKRSMSKSGLKDFNGAIKDCDIAIKINPHFTEAYLQRGSMKFYNRDFKEAEEDFSKVLSDYENAKLLNHEYGASCLNRGVVRIFIENKTGALEDLIKASKYGDLASRTYAYKLIRENKLVE